jgi:arsenical pump membrane protein
VVRAVSANGLGDVVRHVVPAGDGFVSLLAVAAVAALISNLINNLPATLLLLPIVAVGGVGPALAMLIGVDVGPNLSYPGSLATLLWRRAS